MLVRIPAPLRRLTGNCVTIAATGQNVRAVLDDLERQYPGFRKELCDDRGSLKQFINVYVNGQEIRSLAGEDTPVNDGDELSIIPAIAGGAQLRFKPPAKRGSVIAGLRFPCTRYWHSCELTPAWGRGFTP